MMRKIIKIVLVLVWMIMIFLLSNDTAVQSSKKSDGFIIKSVSFVLQRDLTSNEKENVLKYLVVPVRKLAHLFIYFVLGILIISLLKEYRVLNSKVLILSIFICFLYACSDEVHQLFILGRSGEIRDVFIDTFGSFLGILSFYLMKKRKKFDI